MKTPLLPPAEILLVEDNDGDVFLTRRALARTGYAHNLHVVDNGEDAIEFLHKRGAYVLAPSVDIVMLDLNLPRMSGKEVLDAIKTDPDPELRVIPVVMLTSSSANDDILSSYLKHANAYMVKPGDPAVLERLMQNFTRYWLDTAVLPAR